VSSEQRAAAAAAAVSVVRCTVVAVGAQHTPRTATILLLDQGTVSYFTCILRVPYPPYTHLYLTTQSTTHTYSTTYRESSCSHSTCLADIGCIEQSAPGSNSLALHLWRKQPMTTSCCVAASGEPQARHGRVTGRGCSRYGREGAGCRPNDCSLEH
jgi:hypothetical protein